jgi:hypothetical protein
MTAHFEHCDKYTVSLNLESSGMYCRVVKQMLTDVSEVRTASIIRMESSGIYCRVVK